MTARDMIIASVEFEISELPELGEIVIYEVGEENFYFYTSEGRYGFCKVG